MNNLRKAILRAGQYADDVVLVPAASFLKAQHKKEMAERRTRQLARTPSLNIVRTSRANLLLKK